MKIVINACHGGFGLSTQAFDWLIENKGWKVTDYTEDKRGYVDPTAQIIFSGSTWARYYLMHDGESFRTNPDLIEMVEALESDANGRCANLRIVEIPDDVDWQISEYDGWERIAEKHRIWD
jgi:hypothetical protein